MRLVSWDGLFSSGVRKWHCRGALTHFYQHPAVSFAGITLLSGPGLPMSSFLPGVSHGSRTPSRGSSMRPGAELCSWRCVRFGRWYITDVLGTLEMDTS